MERRGMLEPVETVFREITRTGARCRSLKLARDLTSVGLVHHRRLVVKGSPVRGWRPIILARGILPNFSLSLSLLPPTVFPPWRRAGGWFSPKPVHKYYRVALYQPWEKSRGSWTLVNIYFFENGHPSWRGVESLSCLKERRKSITRDALLFSYKCTGYRFSFRK